MVSYRRKDKMFGTLLVILVVVYLTKKWMLDQKYKDLDGPNPWLSFPLIGHGYLLGTDQASTLMDMKKKYGDMFRLDIGAVPTVVLTTYEQAKEALFKEAFSGRVAKDIPTLRAGFPCGHEGITHTSTTKQLWDK